MARLTRLLDGKKYVLADKVAVAEYAPGSV